MARIYTFIIFAITGTLFIAACGDTGQRGIDSQEVKEEIRNREIKYITQPQIIDAASRNGQLMADSLQQALIRQMEKAVSENSLVEAASYCDLQKIPAYLALQQQYSAPIRRLRLKGQQENGSLNDMEKQLLEAYQYNQEKNLPLEKNVQKSGTDQLLFTSPILLNNTVCLKCHGKVGTDVSQPDFQALQATYRMDSLVNYSLNQPIAIWSILFDRKELIKRIQSE